MKNQKNAIVGCPNPFSVAEEIVGQRIDWSKVEDEFDALAECFGITKEGYLSDESPLSAPYVSIDENGNTIKLTEEEAEKRLDTFLDKYARDSSPVEAVNKTANIKLSKRIQKTDFADRRKNAKKVLLNKKKITVVPRKLQPVNKNTEKSEVSSATDDDKKYTLPGYTWKDKGYFFNEVPLWSDVVQNSIGDCYFLAALCSLSYTKPFMIKNVAGLRAVFPNGPVPATPWHEIEFYVPNDARESTQAWSDQKKTIQKIVVSEEVLVNSSTDYNYGASGPKEIQGSIPESKADRDACWPAVYEKAYAKFLERTDSDIPNMTGKLVGGYAEDALKVLMHTEKVTVREVSRTNADTIWNICGQAHILPTCATIIEYQKYDSKGNVIRYSRAGTQSYYLNMGLHISHVYSIFDTITYNGVKYIVIRNPHGRNPQTLKNNPKVYHQSWGFSYGVNPQPEYRGEFDIYQTVSGNDDPQRSQGVFLLELDEFKRVFTTIEQYTGA